MHKPIAVFDAGIGSYAIVAEIQKQLPKQDIIYFADRASFPYGNKKRDQLLTIMQKDSSLPRAPRAIGYRCRFERSVHHGFR